jgi:Zn-dependent protease
MSDLTLIEKIIIWAIPVIFAITVHEVAHGWVANYLGDSTAKTARRLTLNPIRHIDPVGTVIVPAIMLAFSNFVFGWAKPVPVTWQNLHNPRRDMALVAIAGPVANLVMIVIWVIIAKIILAVAGNTGNVTEILLYMCSAGVIINIILMVLNMLPIPPLDGSRVVSSFLPAGLARIYSTLEPFGLIILVVLLFTGILGKILGPAVYTLNRLVYQLF